MTTPTPSTRAATSFNDFISVDPFAICARSVELQDKHGLKVETTMRKKAFRGLLQPVQRLVSSIIRSRVDVRWKVQK